MSLIWDTSITPPPSPPNTYPLQSVFPAHTAWSQACPQQAPVTAQVRANKVEKGPFRRRGGGVQRADAAFELNLHVPQDGRGN